MNEKKIRKQCETIELCIAQIMEETGEDRRAAYRRAFLAYACTRTHVHAGTRTRTVKNIITTTNNINNNNKIKQCVCVQSAEKTASPSTHTQVFDLCFILANAPKSIPEWYVRHWFKTMDQRGWRTKEGRLIGPQNWSYCLGAYYTHASEDEREEAKSAAEVATRRAALREQPQEPITYGWGLCSERCANCGPNGCTRGIKVPPDAGSYPEPPESCHLFTAIEAEK